MGGGGARDTEPDEGLTAKQEIKAIRAAMTNDQRPSEFLEYGGFKGQL